MVLNRRKHARLLDAPFVHDVFFLSWTSGAGCRGPLLHYSFYSLFPDDDALCALWVSSVVETGTTESCQTTKKLDVLSETVILLARSGTCVRSTLSSVQMGKR